MGRKQARPDSRWPAYAGITALLLLIIVALAGGIIWYSTKESNRLAITSAERLMQEAEEKTIDRIRLLYDPMYAIVGIAALVPELTGPAVAEDANARALFMRALRIYPQILSLYVGFDNGNFFMMTHIGGDKTPILRKTLHAPPEAAFAEEIITAAPNGQRLTRWVFLADDGSVVGRLDPVAADFDPRNRPWFTAAKASDVVERSDIYIFATSGEPGFSLSRRFEGATPGAIGADLAAADLADFLRHQQITPGSMAFIFTKSGEVLALPNQALLAKAIRSNGELKAVPPKISELNDPVISGLVMAHQDQPLIGTRLYDVNGRAYIGRTVEIPPRYGRDQFLGIAVPVDEIEQPFAEIRNDTLLYSSVFVIFTLPLFVTLVVMMIDRKLEKPSPWTRFRDDE